MDRGAAFIHLYIYIYIWMHHIIRVSAIVQFVSAKRHRETSSCDTSDVEKWSQHPYVYYDDMRLWFAPIYIQSCTFNTHFVMYHPECVFVCVDLFAWAIFEDCPLPRWSPIPDDHIIYIQRPRIDQTCGVKSALKCVWCNISDVWMLFYVELDTNKIKKKWNISSHNFASR